MHGGKEERLVQEKAELSGRLDPSETRIQHNSMTADKENARFNSLVQARGRPTLALRLFKEP